MGHIYMLGERSIESDMQLLPFLGWQATSQITEPILGVQGKTGLKREVKKSLGKQRGKRSILGLLLHPGFQCQVH